MVSINCASCAHENAFAQPHPYHAGFGNQGFLYNDAGNRTLFWSSFDPDYESIVGSIHPWALIPQQQSDLERALANSPSDERWRFSNHARCLKCTAPISGPITETIYFLIYPGSIDADRHGLELALRLSRSRNGGGGRTRTYEG
jgi:hypothetical protein